MVWLVILSLLSAAAGFIGLTNATAGVGGLAAACLFAILARIVQAAEQHKVLVARLAQPTMSSAARTTVVVAHQVNCPSCKAPAIAGRSDCPSCGSAY